MNHDLTQILADLKKDRPSVKAEHMTGAMYPASTVTGSLVDGFCSLGELAQMAVSEYDTRGGKKLPAKECAAPVQTAPSAKTEEKETNHTNTNPVTTHSNMKQYTQIPALIGENVAFESDLQGCVTLQPHQADALEARATVLLALADENTALKQEAQAQGEKLASAQTAVTDLTVENKDLKEQLAALQEANAGLQAEVDKNKVSIQQAEEKVFGLTEELSTANETIATQTATIEQLNADATVNTQTIADQSALIEELKQDPGTAVDAGEGPQGNGMSAETMKLSEKPKYDPAKSMAENVKIQEEYEKKLVALNKKR